jgi:AcrR family transcriptional regulator
MRVKTEARRHDILEAAAQVFLERGYEAASMAEIASRSGGSKATLYNYFDSKEELFRIVMQRQAEGRIMRAYERLTPSTDLASTLQAFGEHYLSVILSPDLLIMRTIVMGEGPRSSMGKLFYDNGPKEGWSKLAVYLSEQMLAERLRPSSPWRAALHLINLLEADFLELFMTGEPKGMRPEEIQQSVAQAVVVFLGGYAMEKHELNKENYICE